MITTVKLYGFLGKKYGKVHQFDIQTPAEAVKALCSNFPEMDQDIRNFEGHGFRVYVGDNHHSSTEEEIALPFGGEEVRIVPVIQGSKGAGVGQIIMGVVLLVIGYALTFTPFAAYAPKLYMAGAVMILGGVSQMLFAPPAPSGPSESADNNPSYVFNGPINTLAQGHCVPVGYGKLMVGGAVINGGINTEVYPTSSNGGGGVGGGGGGNCPSVDTPINDTPNTYIPAGDLVVGDILWTQDQDTLEWGYYEVVEHSIVEEDCYTVVMGDGRTISTTPNHRVLTFDGVYSVYVWKEVASLTEGDVLCGLNKGIVSSVGYSGKKKVVRMVVGGAHTYQTNGITSHNTKVVLSVD